MTQRRKAVHDLKTWPSPFQATVDGNKGHEIRVNDRDYRVGDMLHLREYRPQSKRYTKRYADVLVTYMTPGGAFGLPKELCVMSVDLIGSGVTPIKRKAKR